MTLGKFRNTQNNCTKILHSGAMADVSSMPDPTQSLKRQLEDEQVGKLLLACPIPPDSPVLEDKKAEENGPSAVTSACQDARGDSEPAAKRLRTENSSLDIRLPNSDARDKIKGIALVKEE
jgi:hypothetical protein